MGEYYHRSISGRLQHLCGVFPVVVVSGARQVGKTTLVQNVFGAEGDYVAFDPVTDIDGARSDPDLFLDNHRGRPLVLDEIQYVPELVAAIKRRVDIDRSPGRFLLTGSQQWEVMKSLAESLAGRAVFIDLEGFSLAELARRGERQGWLARWLDDPDAASRGEMETLAAGRSLYELLWRGWLPEATLLPEEVVPDFHRAYLRTYVERDVRLLAEVSDWQAFGRFVRLAAALTAQEINASQLGRDVGLAPQTARRWLDLLVATFQWFEVPAYSGNTVKRVSGKPKGFIADVGFACSAQSISTPRAVGSHPLKGALFETAVAAELRKQCATLSTPPAIYHWRSSGGAEVDFLLERDGRFFPVEVKLKSQPSRGDTRGISAFRKTYPHLDIAPGLVVGPSYRFAKISDNDYALPWDTAFVDK